MRIAFLVARVCLFVLLLTPGCAHDSRPLTVTDPVPAVRVIAPPTYSMTVNTLGSGAPGTYSLAPADPNVSPDDLLFRELAVYVQRALQARGFTLTDAAHAEQHLLLRQEIAPRVERRAPRSSGLGRSYIYDESLQTVREAMKLPPQVGGAAVTAYTHRLILRAVDAKTNKSLWETRTSHINESPDVHTVMSFLATAAQDYVGHSSGQEIAVRIREDDDRLAFIRTGAANSSQQTTH